MLQRHFHYRMEGQEECAEGIVNSRAGHAAQGSKIHEAQKTQHGKKKRTNNNKNNSKVERKTARLTFLTPGLHVSVRSWGGPGKAPEAEYQAYYPVPAFTPPTTHIVVMIAFQDFPLGHFLFVTTEIKKWFPLAWSMNLPLLNPEY